MTKKHKLKLTRLIIDIDSIIKEGFTRASYEEVVDKFIAAGFSRRKTNLIIRLWEDSISLYKIGLDPDKELKVLCDILENIPEKSILEQY